MITVVICSMVASICDPVVVTKAVAVAFFNNIARTRLIVVVTFRQGDATQAELMGVMPLALK
ncbi:hypothetical protein [uncultured Ferrimonas sp.]|uniref:hypothetical protein n=1 Tax=uncultured Ferrimonas sp. TaxID=432640 RepID=UPI002637D047|nr:hypothetical protein [uncultured Ferrimonas sp.]